MKITKDDVIIGAGYVFEILLFVSAGYSFSFSTISYFAFGFAGILVGLYVSYRIKMRERNRIKNENN